jgi:hypothetical protein
MHESRGLVLLEQSLLLSICFFSIISFGHIVVATLTNSLDKWGQNASFSTDSALDVAGGVGDGSVSSGLTGRGGGSDELKPDRED